MTSFVPASARRLPGGVVAGVALAVGAALISGLSVYLNASAVKAVPDPAVYTTLKNGVAAVLVVLASLSLGGGRAVARIDRRQWLGVVAVAVAGGSVPFILFFTGLAAASAPSAAFIQKTLFVWVALLAVPFLGERLGIATIGALLVLLVGQALILPPTGIVWGRGELMILAATGMWAVETIVVRRLLASIPSHAMAALRLGLGVLALAAYVIATGRAGTVAALGIAGWGWILLTGGILACYVSVWFAALRRAPASLVTSILVLGAVVTGALTALTNGSVPSPTVVAGYGLIVVGAIALCGWAAWSAGRVAAMGGDRERTRAAIG
jgi:drug/metabolite transporter (DMT)-like permease